MDGRAGPVVVLTRATEDNQAMRDALISRGVAIREIPCLEIRPRPGACVPEGPFQAVAFTSRWGVRLAARQGLMAALLPPGGKTLAAAVGSATAQELASSGIRPDLVAEPPDGACLARLLQAALPRGGRIVMVRGNLRASLLDETLARAGYEVLPLSIYDNVEPDIPALAPFAVAAVFVASPSAAQRLLAHNAWLTASRFFCIGRTTARRLKELSVLDVQALGAQESRWIEALHRTFLERKALTEAM